MAKAKKAANHPHAPLIAPPPGLRVATFELGDAQFAMFEWPTGRSKPVGLTRAEGEVVALAADGLSNHEIARRRGTSSRTVANQLAAVFQKLGVSSRSELYALLSIQKEVR